MKYSLRFLPAVEEDAISAYNYYERKSLGLGEEILRLFYTSSSELIQFPELYAKIHGEFRRRLLKRFPYAIYYRIQDKEIIVFGLFHCARKPATIRRSLRRRS